MDYRILGHFIACQLQQHFLHVYSCFILLLYLKSSYTYEVEK